MDASDAEKGDLAVDNISPLGYVDDKNDMVRVDISDDLSVTKVISVPTEALAPVQLQFLAVLQTTWAGKLRARTFWVSG